MREYIAIAPPGSFDQWPPGLKQEMEANRFNPVVGSTLVSETEKLRVWQNFALQILPSCLGRAQGKTG